MMAHIGKRPSPQQIYRMMLQAAGDRAGVLRRSLLLLSAAAVLQGASFALMIPLLSAVAEKNMHDAGYWLWIIGLLFLMATFFRWRASDYDYHGHCARAGDELRRKLGAHLRRIPLQELYRSRSGELNAMLAGTVDELLNYTIMVSQMLINAVLMPVALAATAMFYDWRMGLVLLLTFPLILPLAHYLQPLLARGKRETALANSRLNAELIEYTQGLPVLKAANCSSEYSSRLQKAVAAVEIAQKQTMSREAVPNLLVGSAVEIGMLLVLIFGMMWFAEGSMTLAVLAGLMAAAVRFAEPLSTLLSYIGIYEMMVEGYHRLNHLMTVEPLEQKLPEGIPEHYDIEFEALDFAYRDGTAALKNISLSIPEHAMTALVGSSGCGKTTLTRMVMRYADAQYGSIRIGGVDIRQIPQDKLMSMISVVFQDVYLFDDTVFENIRMGRANADEESVYAAARAARCHDFICKLPEGYQTRVGDIGGKLSGGEKQRISIARALLKNAPIVILDEPTAALDTESELAVQQAVNELVRDKTVIVIAHRLTTIVGAQQIVVMDQGSIVEIGTHQELLKCQGRYAALWQQASVCEE